MSTTGVSPVTVMPSRFTVLKPVSEKVREYVPGVSSVMRYWPLPSVIAVRTFSIRAGLEASTVTPGSTASEASRTTPARVACANAIAGLKKRNPTRTVAADSLLISGASCGNIWGDRPPRRTVRCEARVYAYENFRSIRKREEMHAARTVQYGSTRVWITGRNEASRVVTGRVRVVTGHRTSRHESPDESRRIAGTSAHSLRPVLLRRDSLRPGAESHRPSSPRDHFFRSTSA